MPLKQDEGTRVFNCLDHSGMVIRMNIGIVLLSAQLSLFGYSSFIQLPKIESNLSAQINAMDKRINKCEDDIKRVIAQRNFDHANKDPLR